MLVVYYFIKLINYKSFQERPSSFRAGSRTDKLISKGGILHSSEFLLFKHFS